mmetsp:Transcript_59606/g.141829  ORF Transcript_59606/g.141829 Transcript_59606/m.141829 type:complete len:282 (-) Transcript_59606:141-986(-)
MGVDDLPRPRPSSTSLHGDVRRYCGRGGAIALGVCIIAALRSARAQEETSADCRIALDNMINDVNWQHINASQQAWCRLITENEFANCCQFAEFAKGKAEGCSQCDADCEHVQMQDFCNEYMGKACKLVRQPFFLTGAPEMKISETFCVPQDCDNRVDRENVVMWFHITYRALRAPGSWHDDYETAVLDCPTMVADIIIITIAAVVGIIALVVLAWYLFKAPKERGQTLISQAEMAAQDEEEEEQSQGDLRRAGLGDSQYGQSNFNASYGSPSLSGLGQQQ